MWVAAATLPLLVLRGAALFGAGARVLGPDLRGALSDLGIGLLIAAVASAAARVSRWVAAAIVLLWALLGYGNYEHVKTHAANVPERPRPPTQCIMTCPSSASASLTHATA